MRKNFFLTTTACLALWLLFENFNLHAGAGKSTQPDFYRIKKVVLDAGHGGKDPGCSGSHSKEKHNALAIVLQLGEYIQQNFPEIQVIYTRDTDVFVELNERANIANRANADLFISVHCNAVGASSIKGTETYVMGLHTADENLAVAKRENASIFLEENYQQNYEGYDPNSPEAHIFSAVWQSAYLEQSILLASFVQQFSKEIAGQKDKGVKQAGFLVLRSTAMPSVLIETGYLTNHEDERFLASEEGRQQMALAIFEAFRSYKNQVEDGSGQPQIARAEQPFQEKNTPAATAKPVASSQKTAPESTPVVVHQGAKLLQSKTEIGGKQSVSTHRTDSDLEKQASATKKVRILLTTSTTRLDLHSERFNLVGPVSEMKEGDKFKYFVGTFASRKDAEPLLTEIKNLGFKKAEIVEN